MKLAIVQDPRYQRGVTLIELLVYFALFALVIGLAYGLYAQCLASSRRLQRNASDIVLALDAGERWRDDVRLSLGACVSSNSLVLTQAAGCVEYNLSDNAIWRRTQTNSARLLAHVKNSTMQPEQYRNVAALRWEVELETTRINAPLKPLFTFKAAMLSQKP